MGELSDRVLVSLTRYAAHQFANAPFLEDAEWEQDAVASLEASLAAPDGIPEGMTPTIEQAHSLVGLTALRTARDFVPNHQPTP
jgi:hypothetical protein